MIMGDFNVEEDTETYRSATENFLDVKYQTENPIKSCTYQDWGKRLDDDCIDYIMISKTGFRVNSYNVVRTTYDGVYPSDHFPITASLTLTQANKITSVWQKSCGGFLSILIKKFSG